MGRRVVMVALIVGLAVASGACARSADSSAGSSAGSSSGAGAPPGNVNGVPGAPAAGGNGSGGGELAAGTSFEVNALDGQNGQNGPSGGAFISSATMTVEVDDVSATKPKVIATAIAAGGGLFGEQTTLGEKATSVITVKVPPAQFTKVLDDLAHLGSLASQEVKTDDVTKEVVDLDARITASDASLERTRGLLDKAGSLPDINALEGEIARRQADVESLRGQRKTLGDRVALATIVVTLSNEKEATAAVAEQKRQDELARQESAHRSLPGFGDGFEGGLSVARTVGSLLLAAVGAVLPFLPFLVLVLLVVRLARPRGAPAETVATAAVATDPGGAISGP